MPPKVAKVVSNKNLTHDVIEITFESPEDFIFTAGQFINIKIDDKVPPCFRAYSIASCPNHQSRCFRLCLKVVENGRGSNWLKSLEPGASINYIGPSGKFVFKESEKNALFIATGTGITPFISMIENQLNKGDKRKMHLVFGVRHVKGVIYKDFFKQLAENNPNFTFDYTVSRPENDPWDGKIGRVSHVLETIDLETGNSEVYICGLKEMINDVVALLKNKGFPDEAIHREDYD